MIYKLSNRSQLVPTDPNLRFCFWKHRRTYMKWLFRGEWDDKCANLWLDEWGGIFSWHEKMVSQLSNYVVRFLHLFSFKPKNKIFENIKTWKLWMWQKNLTIWHTTILSSFYVSLLDSWVFQIWKNIKLGLTWFLS